MHPKKPCFNNNNLFLPCKRSDFFPSLVGNTPYLILAVSIFFPGTAPSRFPENNKFIFVKILDKTSNFFIQN